MPVSQTGFGMAALPVNLDRSVWVSGTRTHTHSHKVTFTRTCTHTHTHAHTRKVNRTLRHIQCMESGAWLVTLYVILIQAFHNCKMKNVSTEVKASLASWFILYTNEGSWFILHTDETSCFFLHASETDGSP